MERGRTCNQLRMFAEVVVEGSHLQAWIAPGDPQRSPLPSNAGPAAVAQAMRRPPCWRMPRH